jgi:hypothetical protein
MVEAGVGTAPAVTFVPPAATPENNPELFTVPTAGALLVQAVAMFPCASVVVQASEEPSEYPQVAIS